MENRLSDGGNSHLAGGYVNSNLVEYGLRKRIIHG